MKTVLVTGGAGFIGSHTVDALVDRGYRAVVLDDLSSGYRKNISRQAKLYKFSIENAAAVARVFRQEKPQYVVHLAAQKDVRKSVADPRFDARINIIGGINVLQACVAAKVKKIVFASTGGAIYGDAAQVPTTEQSECQPVSPYGIAKLSMEKYLHYFYKQHGLEYAALRYANVYGPRQDPFGEAGVVAIFTSRFLQQQPVVINGHGRQTRDYVYVSDVVAANVAALESKKTGVWNVGTGKETDVKTLSRLVAAASGSKKKAGHGPAKAGEQLRSAVAAAKIRRDLGWRATTTLAAGVRQTVRWFSRAN